MESGNEIVEIRRDGSKRVKIFFDKVDESTGELLTPSLTKQAFKKDCDINNILAKYEKTGVLDHVSRYQGQYGDFSELQDYHTSLNLIQEADEAFMTLPAKIRKRFNNDAGQFLDFVEDESNYDEMVELGLVQPKYDPPDVKGEEVVTSEEPVDPT